LLLAKFAYNNAPLASTRVFFFFANKGYHFLLNFRLPTDPIPNTAKTFINNLKAVYKFIKLFIKKSQECYQKPADAQRTPPSDIKISDSVFIQAKFIKTTQSTKRLLEYYLGLFIVVGKLRIYFYLVNLPHYLCVIHTVFHIS